MTESSIPDHDRNHLLEYSDEAKSILDDLKNTCNPKRKYSVLACLTVQISKNV